MRCLFRAAYSRIRAVLVSTGEPVAFSLEFPKCWNTHTHTHTHTRPREMDEMSENWGRVPAQRVMNGGEFVAFWTLFFLLVFSFFFFLPTEFQ